MGGVVNKGQDNDELVDNLVKAGYIKTKKVEQVFRAVDRADYVLSSHRESAYKDLAWKHGNIHLSAPCIYSNVMEGLALEPGLSFLNLGSGTGYLSTMAGLILNQHGTNHGIELHEDCLAYAYERLEEFKQKSLALDAFDFCEPLFVQGNCLNIVPGRRYDRVYCGAACPESHVAFIKQFVRVGGILIMPFKEHLLHIRRVNEDTWAQYITLSVTFATLVVPTSTEQSLFHLPECDPLSLQELCRGRIRNRLRSNIWKEHSDLETKKPITKPVGHKKMSPVHPNFRGFVIPIFAESDESASDEDEAYMGRAHFLLNVDTQPGEAITTLQLVRAVMQPQQQQQQDNNQQDSWEADSNDRSDLLDIATDENNTGDAEEENQKDTKCTVSKDRNNQNIETFVDQAAESGSDSACEKSKKCTKNKTDNNTQRSSKESYSNMSDTDSETERETVLTQRKKVAKREKSDSGIIEDVNVTNDDASSSSNTNHSDSETADNTESVDIMDVDLYNISINKSFTSVYNSRPACMDDVPNNEGMVAHYLDSNAFAVYMKDKINKLPLPHSLKMYINYNRKL